MIVQRVLIEMFAEALQGGDCPMDVRGKYHPLFLVQILNEVFSNLVNNEPSIASDMAIDYVITMTEVDGVYTAVLPKPTIGHKGIFRIKSGIDEFAISSREEYRQLAPFGNQKLCELSGADTLKFSQRPTGFPSVTVTQIPNFSSLNATDPVIVEGKEIALFKTAFDMMRRDVIIQEKMNNSRIDGSRS